MRTTAHATRAGPPARSTVAPRRRLAKPLELEREWSPDREATLAALRVTLGLPRVIADSEERER